MRKKSDQTHIPILDKRKKTHWIDYIQNVQYCFDNDWMILNEEALFYRLDWSYIEPQHDKTNKMSVRPVKTQISLGIRPVWSESFAVRMKTWKALVLHYLLSAQRRLRSDWASAKTPIRLGRCPGWSESSLGTYTFCWFCHVEAQLLSCQECLSRKISAA